MKKILFSAYSLDIGGIETSLVTLLNELVKKDYKITLVLEKKQGIFLDELDKNIKIIQYTPNNSRNTLLRKVINMFKRCKFVFKYKNKFDFAVSYATYSLPCSFIARTASKNNCLWVHSEYMQYFKNNKQEYVNFFENLNIRHFKNIVFVSNYAKKIFAKEFNDLNNKCIVINNLIDYSKILKLSEEKVKEEKSKNTILYVGRLTEEDKKISRIIEIAKRLKEGNIDYRVLIIGDGKDKEKYIKQVNEYNLVEQVKFLGKKKNPYPYFKISDFIILTSEYEGFPVIYNEARVLNLPIITTNVSDSEEIIKNKYGIVTEKNIDSIYNGVLKMFNDKYNIKEKFDSEKYNNEIIKKLDRIIN